MKYNKIIASVCIAATIVGGIPAYAAPAQFKAFQSIPVWEKNIRTYDRNGNVLYTPSKTTFKTSPGAEDTSIPRLYPQESIEGKPGEIKVLIENAEQQKWFDNISEIFVYSNDGPYYENSLAFKTSGNSIILQSSRELHYNKNHKIKIISSGYNNVHTYLPVVKSTKPTLMLNHFDVIGVGHDVPFKINDMDYAILSPIRKVELVQYENDVEVGRKDLLSVQDAVKDEFEFSLVGNVFRIYASAITSPGIYKVIVHAEGFKTFESKFEVTGYAKAEPTPRVLGIDTISSATGGGSGGSGGSGGGGLLTQGNIIFNEDLLSNALLLEKLELGNSLTKTISDRWKYDVIVDAAVDEEYFRAYKYAEYYSAVRAARLDGKYLSYQEYIKTSPHVDHNRVMEVQHMLEIGKLGTAMYMTDLYGKAAPKYELKSKLHGEDLVILFTGDDDYTKNITNINTNYAMHPIASDKYGIQGNQLIISADSIHRGMTNVRIFAEGYKTLNIEFNSQPEMDKITLSVDQSIMNSPVTINGLNQDFISNLKTVTVNGKPVLNKAGLGTLDPQKDAFFTMGQSSITLSAGTFKHEIEYTVMLKAEHYPAANITFTMSTKPAEPAVEQIPTIESYGIAYDKNSHRIIFENEKQSIKLKDGNMRLLVNGKELKYLSITAGSTLPKADSYDWNYNYSELILDKTSFNQEINRVQISMDGQEALLETKDGELLKAQYGTAGSLVAKQALGLAIEKAEKIDFTLYKTSSANALRTAITSAKAVLEENDQSKIDQATASINLAIKNLVIKPEVPALNTAALESTIKKGELKLEEGALYTAASVEALTLAVSQGKETLKTATSQESIDQAKTAIQNAIEALALIPAESETPRLPHAKSIYDYTAYGRLKMYRLEFSDEDWAKINTPDVKIYIDGKELEYKPADAGFAVKQGCYEWNFYPQGINMNQDDFKSGFMTAKRTIKIVNANGEIEIEVKGTEILNQK